MTSWLYLTDMSPQATILNLETGEQRRIMSSAVKDKAPIGLRRYLLEEQSGGVYKETGVEVPLTLDLLDDIEEVYGVANNWNYDWPHPQIEAEADADPARREHIINRLHKMMAGYPYEFTVSAVQRRYLMYFSDGNYESQQRFERLIPSPDNRSPYRRDGVLQKRYNFIWNSNMRDAKVPFPKDKQSLYGSLRPCLYAGPAWVVRFMVDGVDLLLDRCRVYVDDDANFICSDWCQRHDYSSYGNGINLQQGIYSFDSWVTGPCMIRNVESGKFVPKSAKVKRTAVRELMRSAPPDVPKFKDTFEKAQKLIQAYSPVTPAAPVVQTIDAGPITADAMAEALAISTSIWSKAPDVVPAPVPETTTRRAAWRAETVVPQITEESNASKRYTVLFNNSNPRAVRAVFYGSVPNGTPVPMLTDEDIAAFINSVNPDETRQGFRIVQSDDGATTYMFVRDIEYEDEDEPLSDHWWMWSAAVHYQAHMMPTKLASVLLEV